MNRKLLSLVVSAAVLGGASSALAEGETVVAYGTGQIAVTPTNPTGETSIRTAVAEAQLKATPAALADAKRAAQVIADAAALTLGAVFSVEQQANPYLFGGVVWRRVQSDLVEQRGCERAVQRQVLRRCQTGRHQAGQGQRRVQDQGRAPGQAAQVLRPRIDRDHAAGHVPRDPQGVGGRRLQTGPGLRVAPRTDHSPVSSERSNATRSRTAAQVRKGRQPSERTSSAWWSAMSSTP